MNWIDWLPPTLMLAFFSGYYLGRYAGMRRERRLSRCWATMNGEDFHFRCTMLRGHCGPHQDVIVKWTNNEFAERPKVADR